MYTYKNTKKYKNKENKNLNITPIIGIIILISDQDFLTFKAKS